MLQLFPAREIALAIGDLEIHWYGILYVTGFVLAWLILPNLQQYRGFTLTRDQWLEVITWSAVGVVAGGRLGYVLFYEPIYFFHNTAEIFALWDGGMASHGGFIGVGTALWIMARHFKINYLALLDVIVVPVALGLALGRLGNFINQELYVSTAAHWAAIGKNIVIAGSCYIVLSGRAESRVVGSTVSFFLIFYAILRFLTEYWRVQEYSGVLSLTRGQILTVPILFFGVMLYLWARQKSNNRHGRYLSSATSG